MTDKTSDDYLNQPEPVVEETGAQPSALRDSSIEDDPVVDAEALAGLKAHFAQRDSSDVPEHDSRGQTETQTLADFVGDQAAAPPSSTSALEAELAELKRQLVLIRMTPQERYPVLLEEAKITLEEAREILDCIIVQLKPWQEEIVVNEHLTIVLQTRGQTDVRRMDKWAEKHKPQLDTTVKAEGLMNSMASSLVAYNDHRFDADDAEEHERWKASYEFLMKMPYPAFRLVQVVLGKFDAKVNAVFADGFLENF